MEKTIAASDLIINADGSIYHLNLKPEDIADTIITVGDQERVPEVSKYFDKIELKKGKREFITHTGYIGKKRITVISTGIGTDNIDIVLNELDALANIDFEQRQINQNHKTLQIIRLGTSGSINKDIEMGSILASSHGLGLDSLMHYYERNLNDEDKVLEQQIQSSLQDLGLSPYLTSASASLLNTLAVDIPKGITVTAPGFYAPQGRKVRAKNKINNLIERLTSLDLNPYQITNLEMETAGIYALANALGHEAISINAILASRLNFEFANNPTLIVENMLKKVLEKLA
ncbi:nucleoside phosphorylase [Pedobacter puniceum]|uniref:Uridine phosphorylase n=1 Tax=Pedobacter puniceum TaxID=2666136 RepID=A0A7K0FRV4_9SPHI|nr:nucleoside phosphorylase [Pedobacter puniceum]MRX48738.1 phosphorylase [Pedobacter puniceum]